MTDQRFISSTTVFSATGHPKPTASHSQSRSPQGNTQMVARGDASVSSFTRGSDGFREFDSMKQLQRSPVSMGSSSAAGQNYQGSFQPADAYGGGYYSQSTNMACNASHAGLPTFSVVQCNCGSRLAYSNGTIVAVLEEGSSSGNTMMASSSRHQGRVLFLYSEGSQSLTKVQ